MCPPNELVVENTDKSLLKQNKDVAANSCKSAGDAETVVSAATAETAHNECSIRSGETS